MKLGVEYFEFNFIFTAPSVHIVHILQSFEFIFLFFISFFFLIAAPIIASFQFHLFLLGVALLGPCSSICKRVILIFLGGDWFFFFLWLIGILIFFELLFIAVYFFPSPLGVGPSRPLVIRHNVNLLQYNKIYLIKCANINLIPMIHLHIYCKIKI